MVDHEPNGLGYVIVAFLSFAVGKTYDYFTSKLNSRMRELEGKQQECEKKHEECEKKHEECEKGRKADKEEIINRYEKESKKAEERLRQYYKDVEKELEEIRKMLPRQNHE